MRRFLLAGAVLAALPASAAMAADMRTKAPVLKAPPPVAVFSWTGFYVGGNIGYSWGRSRNDWNALAPFFDGSTICGPAGDAFCISGSDSNKLNGVLGGLQAGYNWQAGNTVVGLETDFQLSGQRGSQHFDMRFPTSDPAIVGTASADYTQKLAWLGTLRGRLGFAADRWLVYATGGLAYGRVTTDGSATATGIAIGLPAGAGPCTPVPGVVLGAICALTSFSSGVTKVGWTLGVGAEGAIADNWSWKIEYLHVDLGTVNTSFATLPGCFGGFSGGAAACFAILAGSGSIKSRITDEIVRVGVNYRFGAPVVARF
jgi:outer membrane immunogenic protein